tara:strand:- start:17422 stop:18471 length:1050 start_codon:yes stop_codon:yes gene_type:complete
MARISRTDIYDYQTLPTFEDYVIGTDPDDSKRTRNYRIADIIGLVDGTATRFTTLFDTPADYTNQAGKVVAVNGTEDGLTFETINIDTSGFVTIIDDQTIIGDKTFTGYTSVTGLFNSSNMSMNGTATIRGSLVLGELGGGYDIAMYPSSSIPNYSGGANTAFFGALDAVGQKGFSFTARGQSNTGVLDFEDLTQDRVYGLQDKNGTIAHLDDIPASGAYSEGVWTPLVTDSGGGATYSVGTSYAKYVKIGSIVHFTVNLVSINTSGTPTGAFSISLPFPVDANGSSPLSVSRVFSSNINFYSIVGTADNSTSNITFDVQKAADSFLEPFSSVTWTSGRIYVSGSYHST